MNRILYIIGPTATGKTDVALELASRFSGEIIAADSRQVYSGMTIGSGKDIPKGAVKKMSSLKLPGQKIFYHQIPQTRIWGYDLVTPRDDFSVALYKQFIDPVLEDIHARGKLPIIVGGTGFYVQSIEAPPDSLSIPINPHLRKKCADFTVSQLQQYLKKLNQREFDTLNKSDNQNPRRLMRKIEIVTFQKNHQTHIVEKIASKKYDSLWIGLDAPLPVIEDRIRKRVQKRLDLGFERECQTLVDKGFLQNDQKSATATGYAQWLEYSKQTVNRQEFIAKWITAEIQYARRQKTWFKKVPHCTWFDLKNDDDRMSVVRMVENW